MRVERTRAMLNSLTDFFRHRWFLKGVLNWRLMQSFAFPRLCFEFFDTVDLKFVAARRIQHWWRGRCANVLFDQLRRFIGSDQFVREMADILLDSSVVNSTRLPVDFLRAVCRIQAWIRRRRFATLALIGELMQLEELQDGRISDSSAAYFQMVRKRILDESS